MESATVLANVPVGATIDMMERVIAKLYQAQTIGFIKFKIHSNVKIV